MIRPLAVLFLISFALLASIPSGPHGSSNSSSALANLTTISSDPKNGTLAAFNYTYSQANLYTNSPSTPPNIVPSTNATGTSLVWQNTVTRTDSNSTIPGSGFQFNLTGGETPGRKVVSWNITVPKFDCQSCTSVGLDFDLSGSLTKGSNASYILALFAPNSTKPFNSANFTTVGSFPATGTNGCSEIFCINLSSPKNYVGYHLNLTFLFQWNSTAGGGMYAKVGEITVASIGNFLTSVNNYMQQDSNPNLIDHTTTLGRPNNNPVQPIAYNNTLTTRLRPSNANVTLQWNIVAISIYYPSGYNITRVSQNGTEIFPAYTPNPKEVPLETQTCVPGTNCGQALITLNMTDFSPVQPVNVHNSTIVINSVTRNSITQLSTVSGGVSTQYFTSGGQIGVKVTNKPSIVNASTTLRSGTLTITLQSSLGIAPTSQTTSTGGIYTFTLPSTCGFNNQYCDKPLNITATFSSGFDLGNATTTFRIESLQASLTGTGGNNSLRVNGTLQYGNYTPAVGINATLFAIDHGTPTNTPYTYNSTGHSAGQLYISNVTLVNGVFTQGQSLILLFTVVNPNATQAYNATLTIEHDWLGPQRHNMTATLHLYLGDSLGDLAFTNSTARTFQATISFTASGVQAQVKNLATGDFLVNPLNMTQGTSPVLPNAPHPGLFNITIASMINNRTLSSPNWILTPPYAYVSPSFAPARYLYSSPTFTTEPTGAFSTTITTNRLLGAQNLTVFVLARNALGIVVINSLPSSIFSQSTALIPTASSLGPIAESQTATATLNLKSNSTLNNGITEIITVNLVLQGNGLSPRVVGSATQVTIKPGQAQTIQISFTAPATIGSYTLTFTSPEYGGVLTSQTIQVTIVQGYLQFLLPAAIGIVIGIIVLGVYLIRERRAPGEEAGEEKTKPAPKGPSPKPKTAPDSNAPTKSLTQTDNPRK